MHAVHGSCNAWVSTKSLIVTVQLKTVEKFFIALLSGYAANEVALNVRDYSRTIVDKAFKRTFLWCLLRELAIKWRLLLGSFFPAVLLLFVYNQSMEIVEIFTVALSGRQRNKRAKGSKFKFNLLFGETIPDASST